MKKTLLLLVGLLLGLHAFGQSVTKFDKKITYQVDVDYLKEREEKQIRINQYLSKDQKVLLNEFDFENDEFQYYLAVMGMMNLAVSDGKMLTIGYPDFEGNIKINRTMNVFDEKTGSLSDLFKDNEISLTKLGKKGNYNGFDCEMYGLVVQDKNEPELIIKSDEVCACIDTKHKINNLKMLFPEVNVSGLLVAVITQDTDEALFVLEKIKDVDINLNFDFNTLWAEKEKLRKERALEIASEEEIYDDIYEDDYIDTYYVDPICTPYKYFQDIEDYDISYQELVSSIFTPYCTMLQQGIDRKKIVKLMEKQTHSYIKELKKEGIIQKNQSTELETKIKNYLNEVKQYK